MMMERLTFAEVQTLLERSQIPFKLTEEAYVLIQSYFDRRYIWNQRHSIVGPQALAKPWVIDFLDAAALMVVLKDGMTLYDVGAGSGIPGMLIGLMSPKTTVRLVEPLAKRCAFLKSVIHQTGLENISVDRSRWPVSSSDEKQVVSRAVVSPQAWPDLATSAPEVIRFYCYLAQQRPDRNLTGYALHSEAVYTRNGQGSFLVEAWERKSV